MKNESSLISGYHGAYLSAVLLLFALVPLAATIQVTHNESYALTSSTCQAVQIQYPNSATAGQKVVIVTMVPSSCMLSTSDYNEVIVNILLSNTSRILSTASATNGPATNTVTAPATGGPWNLVVQVSWINYPTAGTLAMYQTTITIMVNGPSAISKVTSTTASSTRFISSTKTSSTVLSYSTLSSVQVVSSTVIPYSTSSKNFTSMSTSLTNTSESTIITSSILLSNSSSNNPFYSWLNSPFALILAVALVALLVVGVFVLRRRRR